MEESALYRLQRPSGICEHIAALACIVVLTSAASCTVVAQDTAKGTTPLGSNPPSASALHAHVISEARRLAAEPHRPSKVIDLPWLPKGYDDAKRLQLRRESAIWASNPPHFEIHPLPAGWLFVNPVEIAIVEDGVVSPIILGPSDLIDNRVPNPEAAIPQNVPLSGFRINGALNAPLRADEIISFQGATYFRGLAEGHVYGLSARGLAIGTATVGGEEFPEFRKFWIEKPLPSDKLVKVSALLDSPSTSGAFTFLVTPGKETVVDVSATLFPRNEVKQLGIAPLTSMFLLAPSDPTRVADFRPRVHDSDGLSILTGKGERIWRPLSNPRSLQVSAFMDNSIRGFGLIQRHRVFPGYEDLEARYERRPSVWVEPITGFENGNVVLVEIPTEEEIHDNIVAFFRPNVSIQNGAPLSFSYRLRWRDDSPTRAAGPWIVGTRVGSHGPDGYRFVIDYLDDLPSPQLPIAKASASAGRIEHLVVQANPETRGFRVTFVLYPGGANLSELQLSLNEWGDRTPETWLYRWTKRK